MSILTLGLLGLASLTVGVMRGNLFSKNVTTATVIAERQLEDVQRAGYANTTTMTFSAAAENVFMGGVGFTRQTTISNGTPAANMKTVTVTVSWDSGARSVTLDSIISEQ